MMNSILMSIKKLLNISSDDTSFDTDVIIHINSALSVLTEIGIGPTSGYSIVGDTETWEDFYGESVYKTSIQTYVYLKTKLIFDPPSSSFVLEALKREKDEIEWRLNNKTKGA